MCGRRKLDGPEALVEEARRAGLDGERFRIDLESNATLEAFGGDLEESRTIPDAAARQAGLATAGSHGSSVERLQFPALRLVGEDGESAGWAGDHSYEDWRAAASQLGAAPSREPRPDVAGALRRFGRMATAELEAVCDLPGPRAGAEVWRLASEWRVRRVPVLAGELWELGLARPDRRRARSARARPGARTVSASAGAARPARRRLRRAQRRATGRGSASPPARGRRPSHAASARPPAATGRPGGSRTVPVILPPSRPPTLHATARAARSSIPTALPSEPVTARPGRAARSATVDHRVGAEPRRARLASHRARCRAPVASLVRARTRGRGPAGHCQPVLRRRVRAVAGQRRADGRPPVHAEPQPVMNSWRFDGSPRT